MPTVLVVDDRALNREFLATLLGYGSYTVIEAADGVEALAMSREHRPELIISDILMPNMDGIEFVNNLRADPVLAPTPVLFYTATYRLTEARAMAQACGVRDVLAKPSDPQTILDAVAQALGLQAGVKLPAATTETSPLEPHSGALPIYMQDLVELQQRLQNVLSEGLAMVGENGSFSQLSDRLVESFATVQALSLRMAALLELGLTLSMEREPRQLLALFCRAAQDIMNAKYTAVGIFVDGEKPRYACQGMDDEEVQAIFDALKQPNGILGECFRQSKLYNSQNSLDSGTTEELPSNHPLRRAFLLVPLLSGTRPFGWFYLADKLGVETFNAEDEQFAVTLAAQLAPLYENLELFDEVQKHAGQLEFEVAERKRSAEDLQQSELRFRQLAENIREVFFLMDPATGEILYVSPAYEEMWGCSCTSLYADPSSWTQVVHPQDREWVLHQMKERVPTGKFDLEYRMKRPESGTRWVRARGFPIRNAAGEIHRIAGITDDITEAKEQQQKIARLSRIYAVLSGINSALVRIHDRTKLFQEACRITVTEGAFKLAWIGEIDPDSLEGRVVACFGGEPSELRGDELSACADSVYRDRPACRAAREMRPMICNDVLYEESLSSLHSEFAAQGYCAVAAFPLIVGDRARAVLVLYAGEIGFFDDEEIKLLNELAGDISFGLQYIEKEEQLYHLAYYDALTGLANSRLFYDRLTQFIHGHDGNEGVISTAGDKSAISSSKTVIAVILVDLDRFTQINDSLGRHVGDVLLKELARRFQNALQEPYTLARISADAFAVAVAKLPQATEAAVILREQLFRPLNQPFIVDDEEVRLSARAGIALYPHDGKDAETLFKNAEAALKQAQVSGDRYLYYAPEINAQVKRKMGLENKLRQAVELRQFVLHYQPKLDTKSGCLAGLEALIRWNDPENELVLPEHFIGALEETGMIVEVGQWVIQQALADYHNWRQAGLNPPRIAVNVSPLQLQRHNFFSLMEDSIANSGESSDGLELEITESLIMKDIDENIKTLRKIRDAGVSIAIDDFGTGYSSLRYLSKLPVDSLKIDRSFIVTMMNEPDSMAIVSSVISLAHSLNLSVIAEGVDSEEQSKFLRLMKCDEMQGFLFSEAVRAEECALLF